MRLFGLLGLVLVLVVVGVLVKKQLSGVAALAPPPTAAPAGMPNDARHQAQQLQQFKQSLDAAMQSPRPLPDDAR